MVRLTLRLLKSEKTKIKTIAQDFEVSMTEVVLRTIQKNRSPLPPFRHQRLLIHDIQADLEMILSLISSPSHQKGLQAVIGMLDRITYHLDFSVNQEMAPPISRSPERVNLQMLIPATEIEKLDSRSKRFSYTRNHYIRQRLVETVWIVPQLYDLEFLRSTAQTTRELRDATIALPDRPPQLLEKLEVIVFDLQVFLSQRGRGQTVL